MTVQKLSECREAIRAAQTALNTADHSFEGGEHFTEEEVALFEDIQKAKSVVGRMFLAHYDILKNN